MVNIRKVVSLGYLFSNGGVLMCRCDACGHTETLPARPLLRRYGAGCPVTRLVRWLACSRCGGKGGTVKAVWPPDPDSGKRLVD